MLGPIEREEIRNFVHEEMAEMYAQVAHEAGSYNYLCCVGGLTVFTHRPMGAVLYAIPHFKPAGA